MSQTYTCGDAEALDIQYVTSGANALITMPFDGEKCIFVNAVSDAAVWWTRGDPATRENEMTHVNFHWLKPQASPAAKQNTGP